MLVATNTIQETGSIVLVEMYAGIIIIVIICGIVEIIKSYKNNKKK